MEECYGEEFIFVCYDVGEGNSRLISNSIAKEKLFQPCFFHDCLLKHGAPYSAAL